MQEQQPETPSLTDQIVPKPLDVVRGQHRLFEIEATGLEDCIQACKDKGVKFLSAEKVKIPFDYRQKFYHQREKEVTRMVPPHVRELYLVKANVPQTRLWSTLDNFNE